MIIESIPGWAIAGYCAIQLTVQLASWRKNGRGLMEKQMQDLHDWQGKEDVDGVKLMYFRRSLEVSIDGLTKAIDEQTESMRKLHEDHRRQDTQLKMISDAR